MVTNAVVNVLATNAVAKNVAVAGFVDAAVVVAVESAGADPGHRQLQMMDSPVCLWSPPSMHCKSSMAIAALRVLLQVGFPEPSENAIPRIGVAHVAAPEARVRKR